MIDRLRRPYEVLLTVLVLTGTTGARYWLLREHFGVTAVGALILLAPILVPGVPFFVYSYCVGLRRLQNQEAPNSRMVARSTARISLFVLLMLLPTLLTIHFLVAGALAVALVFMAALTIIAFWAIRKISEEVALFRR